MPSLANIYCHDVPSGLSLVGVLRPDGDYVSANQITGLTVTEVSGIPTDYVLNAGVAGLHEIFLKDGSGNVVWKGWTPANLANTGTFEALNSRAEALAATQDELDKVPKSDGNVAFNETAMNQIADATLDRTDGVETDFTLRQAQRIQLSAAAGKLDGAATTEVAIRDVNDSKDRITATVDSDGNRTAVVLDPD